MGIFNLFKKNKEESAPKGFFSATIRLKRLTDDAVQVSILPIDEKQKFNFTPGQYINIAITLNGEQLRRSYSLCSHPNEGLEIGVKTVDKGLVSNWFNQTAKDGDTLFFSKPEGNFVISENAKKVVAIAAGSGITPILSIAKSLPSDAEMFLIFGNKSQKDMMFREELSKINNLRIQHFFSKESGSDATFGRITEDSLFSLIKQDLTILRSDVFLLCGPEDLIFTAKKALNFFGVPDEKIKFELFTAPVKLKPKEAVSDFKGTSKVKVILDQEVTKFDLAVPGNTVLEAIDKEGLDAPYSCKGGVCSSCRAKVLEGSASMRVNYSLTDEEVQKGYILTCQAIPQSSELTISFDE
jgi:ring-1,2-phenylacetyl-CoA epoxidase subunit PaaE